MVYEAEKVGSVEGLGDVYRVDAPLGEQLKAFQKVGISTLVSPAEVAQIRLADIGENWSRTNVAPLAMKGARTILVKKSPLMNSLMAVLVTNSHRNGKYFTLQDRGEMYEVAKARAKDQEGLDLEERTDIVLS